MASNTAEVPDTSDNSLSMKTFVKGIKMKFPAAVNISTRTAHTWAVQAQESARDRDLMFLDCRDEGEYIVSHIDGAVQVNGEAKDLQQTQQYVQEKVSEASSGLDVVCYCSLGYRSSNYAQLLASNFKGVDKVAVYNLEGSLFKWANEGRPVVDNNGQLARKVHPYNSVFGKVLNSDLRLNTV